MKILLCSSHQSEAKKRTEAMKARAATAYAMSEKAKSVKSIVKY
jgi:hypothetical protein